jgi:hypothetical protein
MRAISILWGFDLLSFAIPDLVIEKYWRILSLTGLCLLREESEIIFKALKDNILLDGIGH